MPILRLLAVVVFLLCVGSSQSCHHQNKMTLRQSNFVSDRIPRPHQFSAQAYYIDVLNTEYEEQIASRGVDLAAVETRVYWTRTSCPNGRIGLYHKLTDADKFSCYHGLTWTCEEIYVADVSPLSYSAFTHELGHCYYRHLFGTKDAEHKDEKFWKLVDKVDGDLAERGW